MEDILDLKEKYLKNHHDRDNSSPRMGSRCTDEAESSSGRTPVRSDPTQEMIDEEIERTEKMLKAIEKLSRLDERLKTVLKEEKMVKARSLVQQRKTFAELVAIQGNSTDTKKNIERYLSLLPPRACSSTPRGNSAGPLRDENADEVASSIGDGIFFRTQVPRSETSSRVGDAVFSDIIEDDTSTLRGSTEGDPEGTSEAGSKKSNKSGLEKDGDFVRRNVELAKNAKADNYGVMMTEEEQKRLESLLDESDEDSEETEDITTQLPNNRLPSIESSNTYLKGSGSSMAITKFLPEVERLRLAEVEDKLSIYQSHRSGSQLDFNDAASILSSTYSSDLSRIEDNQAKMNFINARLKQVRSGSTIPSEEPSPAILPSSKIEALLTEIQMEQADYLTSTLSEEEDSGDDDTLVINRRALPPVELSRATLDDLLENARSELNLDHYPEEDVHSTSSEATNSPRPPSRTLSNISSRPNTSSSIRSIKVLPNLKTSRQSTPNNTSFGDT